MTFDEMMKLKYGWDSYSAIPPNQKAIDITKDIIKVTGMPHKLSASVIGGTGMSWTKFKDGKRVGRVYVEVNNEGLVLSSYSDGTPEGVVVKKVTNYKELLKDIFEYLK